jgi:transcriptional regulator with PAS, ATPase and Fis domain
MHAPGSPAKSSPGASVDALMDCLDAPAVVIDHDHRIVCATHAYRERHGNGRPLEGRTCHEISHGLHVPCGWTGTACPLRECVASGTCQRVLHTHRSSHGEVREHVLLFPLRERNGKIARFLELMLPVPARGVPDEDEELVGRSPGFLRMLAMVERVAPTDTTVLLLGESGTGKELVARHVHRTSARSAGPFVPLDCSGLNDSLFESELFGHDRGAFTGAHARKEGLIEAARGGTLFLDEIGDIPLELQVKFLRVLESGVFRRVGSVDPNRADFRLVCATHRDLKKMVADGAFRPDLYYRISAFPVVLPALRQRRGDLSPLCDALLARMGSGCRLGQGTLAALGRYAFPGNVRELRNVLERACLLSDDRVIRPEHLPEEILSGGLEVGENPVPRRVLPLHEVENHYLAWALAHFEGDHRSLAGRLGVSERTLYRKVQRLRGPAARVGHAPEGVGTD